MREQSQIEAMREAFRGDRERAEARRKARSAGGTARAPTTRHEPPAAQAEAPAAPPGPADARK